MHTKKCRACGEDLPPESFNRNRTRADGREDECRVCANRRKAEQRRRQAAATGGLSSVYAGMRKRCYCRSASDWKYYGGRGIRICDAWLDDRNAFYAWAAEHGYRHGLQIDRINNRGDYEPSNCRFVEPAVNARNRTSTKLSERIASAIRDLYESGCASQQRLANAFGVARRTVRDVCSGRHWAPVETARV